MCDRVLKALRDGRRPFVSAAWILCWFMSAGVLSAQDEFEFDPTVDAHYRQGAIAYTPAIVFSAGYDTNVYREAIGFADTEIFAVPQIEAWWTQPGFVVTGKAAVEAVSFQNHEGAVNHQLGARIDRSRGMIAPYFGWNHRQTNAGPTGFEVGYKSLRKENSFNGGARMLINPRARLHGYGSLVQTRWDADARYQTSNLKETLNRDTLGAGVGFAYAVTPLTGVGVSVDAFRDQFLYSPVRDGDTVRIGPTVDFAPKAFVFGTASFGIQSFKSKNVEAADLKSRFLSANLGYGVPEGTLIRVVLDQQFQYSYDTSLSHYLITSVAATAARRVAERWDLAGFIGRYALSYPADLPGPTHPPTVTREFGGVAAYRVGRWTRIGVSAERALKNGSDGYDAVRVVGFMTHGSGRFQRLDRPIPFER
jgi:hypothetical protein